MARLGSGTGQPAVQMRATGEVTRGGPPYREGTAWPCCGVTSKIRVTAGPSDTHMKNEKSTNIGFRPNSGLRTQAEIVVFRGFL